MSTLSNAVALAADAFKNKIDKSGRPYILHLLRVMLSVQQHGDEVMIVAVLHDILEDIPSFSVKKLLELGYSEKIVWAVSNLTRLTEHESYTSYIDRCKANPICRIIKLADLEDNINTLHLKSLSQKDLDRVKKYHDAHKYLKQED